MRNAKYLAFVFAILFSPAALCAPPAGNGFIVASGNGTLVRSSFGLTVTRVTTGQYEVDSTVSIHSCAYLVAAGSGNTTIPQPSIATAVGRRENLTAIMIATFDSKGNYADADFHLIVQCKNMVPNAAATVNADGTLARGVQANSASRTGTGAYTVTFSNSGFAATCAYPASIGLSATSGISDPGFVNVAALSGGTIAVRTYDTKGIAADRGFHIYAMCNL